MNCFILLIFFISSVTSLAASVARNTNGRIILNLSESESPAIEDKYSILDQDSHKEIGLVQIKKVQGQRALAKLVKGEAKPGDQADASHKTKSDLDNERTPADAKPKKRSSKNKKKESYFGVGVSAINATTFISVDRFPDGADGGDGSAIGSSMALDLYWDHALSKQWALNVSISTHNYKTSVDDANLQMEIAAEGFLVDLIGRYYFNRQINGLWLGGGLGYFIASKGSYTSNHSVTEEDITPFVPVSTPLFDGSAGYNMKVGDLAFGLRSTLLLFLSPQKNDYQTLTNYHLKVSGALYF